MFYRRPEEPAPGRRAVTRNVGVGGAFILCDAPPAVGQRLLISIDIPTAAAAIELQAEVRWIVRLEEDPEGAGMGVKFLGVGTDELLILSEYFASLTRETGS